MSATPSIQVTASADEEPPISPASSSTKNPFTLSIPSEVVGVDKKRGSTSSDTETQEYIQLFFSAKILNYFDFFAKNDACLALFLRNYDKGSFVEIGRTNVCKDNLRPVFFKSILVDTKQAEAVFEQHLEEEVKKQVKKKLLEQPALNEREREERAGQPADEDDNFSLVNEKKVLSFMKRERKETEVIRSHLKPKIVGELRAMIFDGNTTKDEIEVEDLIGYYDFRAEDVEDAGFVIENKLLRMGNQKFGSISMYAEVFKGIFSRNKVRLLIAGSDIPKVDLLSNSDPFFVIYREVGDGPKKKQLPVYVSEAKSNTVSPYWNEVVLPEIHLCKGDRDMKLKIVLYDFNVIYKNMEIGQVEFSVNDLLSCGEKPFKVTKTGFLSKLSKRDPELYIVGEILQPESEMSMWKKFRRERKNSGASDTSKSPRSPRSPKSPGVNVFMK